MPSPRKRKAGAQIGRVLAKGGTSTEATFTTAQLENLMEIGLYGHDGDGGFTHGNTGNLRKNPSGASLDEDAGLDTAAELASSASGRFNTAGWDTSAVRHYLSSDTTLIGLTEGNPATAANGILHCPAGPDAKLVGKLEDVSNGSAVNFWILPTGWSTGDELKIRVESAQGNNSIAIIQGDNSATVETHSNVVAAGSGTDVLFHTDKNETKGIKVQVTTTSTSTTETAGWQVAWRHVAS